MKCPNCGTQSDSDARFCKTCGFELVAMKNSDKVEENLAMNSMTDGEEQEQEASFLEKLAADLVFLGGMAIIVIVVLALLGVFN